MITLSTAHIITLSLAFVSFMLGAGKLLLLQFEKRLDTRFDVQNESRRISDEATREMLSKHMAEEAKNSDQILNLERQLLNFKADLPIAYVRREDFVRNQSVIESKLDGLALRIENVQLKGGLHVN